MNTQIVLYQEPKYDFTHYHMLKNQELQLNFIQYDILENIFDKLCINCDMQTITNIKLSCKMFDVMTNNLKNKCQKCNDLFIPYDILECIFDKLCINCDIKTIKNIKRSCKMFKIMTFKNCNKCECKRQELFVFCVSNNILRIMHGCAELRYSI